MKLSNKLLDNKKRPRVGIDARFFGPKTGGGLGRYTEELIRGLHDLKPNLDIILFCLPEAEKELAKFTNFKTIPVNIRWYTLKEQFFLRSIIDNEKLDLYHVPHWNVPIGLKTPFITTIHDLILLEEPHSAHASTRHPLVYKIKYWGFKKVLKNAIFKAKKILTVSETSKKSIKKFFPLAKTPIEVIYPGIGIINQEPVFERLNQPKKPFALMVGNAYPHKNISIILKSLVQLKKEGLQITGVLAGKDDYFSQQVTQEAKEMGLTTDDFLFISNPTDVELSFLYQNAEIFLFPSKCEGFGIPPLEAMAYGVPVISSNSSVMPEILGDAAFFVDPNNKLDFVKAIKLLLTDQEKRKSYIAKGIERTKLYNWKKMAQGVLKAYTTECILE